MESHYEALGLQADADDVEVRDAYRRLLKNHHPDVGGSREQFLQIKTAYEAITGESAPDNHQTDGGAVSASVSTHSRRHPTGQGPRTDHGLTVQGEYLALSLVALPQAVELTTILGDRGSSARRCAALFEVHNPSSRTLRWQGRAKTSFVGDDGFLYEGSSIVTPHAEKLPQWWCGTDIDLQPGRTINAIVIAQEIPEDVTIEKVIYTQHVTGEDGTIEDTERYLFEIKPLVREHLDHVPFDS